MMGWGYGGYGGYGGAFGWIGPIMMLIFWLAIIAGIIFLVRFFIKQGSSGGKPETSLDILKKRYARGEIGREEYEEKKKDLREP
jgi:putative membrane protein